MARALLIAVLLLAAFPATAEEGFATSKDGIPIAWTLHGEGPPPLVLVHGWSCDQTYWREQVDHFAGDHRVVTIDLAGHGRSGFGREDWTMASYGGDVAAVMQELELEDVILVGHSMGGDVIVAAARQARDRVQGMIWLDVYRSLGTPRTDQEVEATMAPFREDLESAMRPLIRSMFPADADPELVAWILNDMTSAPPEVALGELYHAIRFDRRMPGLLAEIDLPVVAINADFLPTDIESLNRHDVEVVVMPGVGHFLMMEDPERFNALLAEAIASIEKN